MLSSEFLLIWESYNDRKEKQSLSLGSFRKLFTLGTVETDVGAEYVIMPFVVMKRDLSGGRMHRQPIHDN